MALSRRLAAIVLVAAVALPGAAAADWVSPGITLADVANVASGDTLNLRAAPSASARIVGTLTTDAGVNVVRCIRDPHVAAGGPNWCYVTWGSDAEGWANARYLVVHPGVHEYRE